MVEVSFGQLNDGGRSTSFDGTGYVQASTDFTHVASGTYVPNTETSFAIADGRGTISLIASDAAGFDKTGWTYHFRFVVTSPIGDPVTLPTKDVLLPAAAPAVDFEILLASDNAFELVQVPYVISVAGLTGIVAAQDLADAVHDLLGIPTIDTVEGPAGADGAVGPQGPDGPAGPPGVQRMILPYTAQGTLVVAAGVSRIYNDGDADWTINHARASLDTAPTGSSAVFTVKVDGTAAFTITVPISAFTGTVDPAVTVPVGSYLTVDVTQVGSTTPGADATVVLDMTG